MLYFTVCLQSSTTPLLSLTSQGMTARLPPIEFTFIKQIILKQNSIFRKNYSIIFVPSSSHQYSPIVFTFEFHSVQETGEETNTHSALFDNGFVPARMIRCQLLHSSMCNLVGEPKHLQYCLSRGKPRTSVQSNLQMYIWSCSSILYHTQEILYAFMTTFDTGFCP